ncbi:hypothetical protein [Lacrimispora sp.]|uniref:hypothetical protein n=1 Tax=Lacrimispora sp. TaxID=2719234 RepID=UPI0028ABF86E|nr:hypothetical protein [Lacrimispora sp.]
MNEVITRFQESLYESKLHFSVKPILIGGTAMEEDEVFIISIDRLLWSRVCAMEVEKYRNDLMLMKEYYYNKQKDLLQ